MKTYEYDKSHNIEHQNKVEGTQVEYWVMSLIAYVLHLVKHFVFELFLSSLIKLKNKTRIDVTEEL